MTMGNAMKLAYTVDMQAPMAVQMPVTLLMQGDDHAQTIEVTLENGSDAADLTGMVAVGYLVRADGIKVRCPGSIDGHTLTVPLLANCYTVRGPYTMNVLISKTDYARTVLRLRGRIEGDGDATVIDPTGSIPTYEDIAQLQSDMADALEECADATSAANGAATTANAKAVQADAAAAAITGLTVAATNAAAGGDASAVISEVDGHKHIAFVLPTGATGPQGPQGVPGNGNVSSVCGVQSGNDGNVALTPDDLGAAAASALAAHAAATDNPHGVTAAQVGAALAAAGVPTGGAENQVLTKLSGADHNVGWADPAVPAFGSAASAGVSLAAGATADITVPDVPSNAVILGMYSTQYAVSCNYGGRSGATVTCRCRNNGTGTISTMYVYVSYVTGGGVA